jgi:hypothetical protein
VLYRAAAFTFGVTRVRLTFCGRPAFTLCATPFMPEEAEEAPFDDPLLPPLRGVPFGVIFPSTTDRRAPVAIGTFEGR